MVYIFIMLIMQLISTINWLQRIWIYRYIYFNWIDIHCWAPICIQLLYIYTNKVLNWSTLNDNILAVGIILLEWAWELYTRPNHHCDIKLLKGGLRKEGTLSGYRQNIKKVYFDLKSRCKEIKDHNFLPFLQLYDFA